MLLRENTLFGTIRGQSTAPKKTQITGLRSIVPKFLRDIGNSTIKQKKNSYELNQQKIITLKKQNIKPQIIELNQPKQQKCVKKIQQKLCIDKLRLYPRGFHNIGNSCYMNSTLQCLFHLLGFSQAIKNQCLQMCAKNRNIPAVTHQMFQTIKQLQSKGGALNLVGLKKALGRNKPIFFGHAQQDAQQYLTALFQSINLQMTRITKKCPYQQLEGDPDKKQLSLLSNQWWQYNKKIDNSIICDLFQGQSMSTISCRKCGKDSVNFDNFWGLPVTLSKNKSINQLLISTWKSESLIEDYYCGKCKKHRNSNKISQIFRLPQILIVQLKRFQYQFGQKYKKKDEIKIDFELQLNKTLNQNSDLKQNTKYKLKGIVHHHGEAEYGHYYADVFCDATNKWYCLNDSNVQQNSVSKISKSAYLLFYQQIK